MKKKTSHPQQESVSTYRREISIAIFCKSSQMYSPYFFFFFGGGGWGGDLKTDHEAMIIYLLAGFFGSKSQSTFLIFNPSLERLFSAFWKKKGWGGGGGRHRKKQSMRQSIIPRKIV